ncbi:TauD/TfdA dioxygenase family protein [Pollutimonas thiosulfatoxidans]|uniref:TauD/TfdA-like domain-containing protein n=1 Tax=Pollutimonas thiosulfatoxidans TaxID=2028345 RepID=A0A410G8L9_9BURK|nr:TauD/TfdA family dioxygenase [Pollutimonas thiosulfatoxidans]QAA92652.1 hypothetical protein CKA81_01425 [Pollutimonas thiosulfatoxidans]
MVLTINRLHESFAAEITNAKISEGLADAALEEIANAIDQYGVVVLRDQEISNEQQISFAENFGTIEPSVTRYRKDTPQRISQTEIVDVSNLDTENRPRPINDRLRMLLLGNRLWHTDSSFRAVPGALSMLLARSVPLAGGDTQFSDTCTAYQDLSEPEKQRIEDMKAEHSLLYSREQLGFSDFSDDERAALPPVQHPVVRRLPTDGRKSLYIGSHASHLIGMPLPEGRMTLRDLLDHATQPQYVYSHKWRVGDLVIWDNRRTLHRGKSYDESCPRDLRRVTTSHVQGMSTLASLKSRRPSGQEIRGTL